MFFSPPFEPHSPLEPQWFPRPITDAFESQLDQLERLEEDRKRRLRSIANVSAKTPIGLGGEASSATPSVPGAAANLVPGQRRHNSYAQHCYYPPPSEESMASFQHDRVTAPPSAPSTRRKYYRNIRVRPSAASEAAPTPSSDTSNNNLSHLSHSHIPHDRTSIDSIQSFNMTSPLFHSPPLDPRGGGGRRNNNWYTQQLQQMQRQETPREAVTPRSFAFVGDVTPEDRVTATPGHGHSVDVYTQRRRRRRMEID